MKWKNTSNRFVAFFDIMGFKNMVHTNSHEDVINLMSKISSTVKEMDNDNFGDDEDTIVKTSIFSDSIVIISNKDTVEDAAHIMWQCAHLFQKCTEYSIPIKGCITYGKFTADFDKSIFFGQPLIDAYLLQEELGVYSVVIHHSFESFMLGKTYGKEIFPENIRWVKYPTPFKSGVSNHYHLNWYFYQNEEEKKRPQVMRLLLNKFYSSVSGKTRSYVDNTLTIFEKMIEPWTQ